MNPTYKTALIAALTALVVVFVVAPFLRGAPGVNTIERIIRETVGAIPGNEIQGPELIIGGVKKIYSKQQMVASNTPCALRVSATSSLDRVSILHTEQFANAPTWMLTTSTARTATGTIIFSQTLPINAGASLSIRPSASSTPNVFNVASSSMVGVVLKPNDWVNVNVNATAFSGADEIRGACGFELTDFSI